MCSSDLYKGSVLGWFWSLLNPLTTVAVFTFFFAVLGVEAPVGDPSGLKVFALYLITGLVPWNFFAQSLSGAAGSVVAQGALISKVYFPRGIVVIAKIGAVGFTALMEFSVAVVILLIAGNMVLPWIPVVVVLVAIQTVMVLGIGLLLSAANVYFRDVRHFVTLIMPVLFYSTPVVYPITTVPETWNVAGYTIPLRQIYTYNPLVRLVTAYRDALYSLRMPSWETLGYIALWAIGLVLVGQYVFNRLDHRLAEEV